jgi:hypothetical protein
MARIVSFLRRIWQRLRAASSGGFLCDSCKYDYPGACDRPERPNAKACDEFRPR